MSAPSKNASTLVPGTRELDTPAAAARESFPGRATAKAMSTVTGVEVQICLPSHVHLSGDSNVRHRCGHHEQGAKLVEHPNTEAKPERDATQAYPDELRQETPVETAAPAASGTCAAGPLRTCEASQTAAQPKHSQSNAWLGPGGAMASS